MIKYCTIRLLALRTDLSSFSSTYEHETAFTDTQWGARLDHTNARTFVAIAHKTEQRVGMLAVGTSPVLPALILPPIKGKIFWAVGMWVHPEHRRNGLGKRLMEEALWWASGVEDDNSQGAHLALTVAKANGGPEYCMSIWGLYTSSLKRGTRRKRCSWWRN